MIDPVYNSLVTAGSTRSYLGRPTILRDLSTSTKKDRAKKKLQRKNKQKGRKRNE